MADSPSNMTILRVADLSQRRPTRFDLAPDKDALTRIAKTLEITGIRKLTFRGTIAAEGNTDWRIDAQLGATVVQACVVTLAPVTTRIDRPVTRRFLADFETGMSDEEIEMPEDDLQEPLAPEIDLMHVATEALTLALPDYPRCESAQVEQTTFTAPGITPMTDEEIKPFAGLASLRDKLKKPD